ncbi:hypothetical protein CR513_22707, partial [Mucuna pruriens]
MDTLMNQKEKFIEEDEIDKVGEVHFRSLIGCITYLTSTRPGINSTLRFKCLPLMFKEVRDHSSINRRCKSKYLA